MPTRFNDHGNLEAEMIRIADPSLARHTSNYGHAFDADAPFGRAAREWILQRRPVWLRRRMQHRGAGVTDAQRAWHEEWAGELLDLGSPLMREIVDPDSVRHSEAFGNACNLAYLVQDLGIRDVVEDGPARPTG